jgi:maltose O-acetyltransferase
VKYLLKKSVKYVFQKLRVFFYTLISDRKVNINRCQPVIASGAGVFSIHKSVKFGVKTSPSFYNSYSYIEARKKSSKIEIGEGTVFNNNASIIADAGSITIGNKCIIGTNFHVINSDFHAINRHESCEIKVSDVKIGDNVFIGNNVSVLKGVYIPSDSVVANGSVVTKPINEKAIIGGNPAKVLKLL